MDRRVIGRGRRLGSYNGEKTGVVECSDLQEFNGGSRERTGQWYVGKGLRSEVSVQLFGFCDREELIQMHNKEDCFKELTIVRIDLAEKLSCGICIIRSPEFLEHFESARRFGVRISKSAL